MLLFLFVAYLPLSLSAHLSPIKTNVSATAPLIEKRAPSRGQIMESRSLMDMLNPFSKLKKFQMEDSTEESIAILEERCKEIPGTAFVNNECYAYFNMELNFYDAQAFCINQKGKLWTPDLTDPFLFEKMMRYLPESIQGPRESLWLNAVYDLATDSYTDGDNRDITNDYLILVNENDYVDITFQNSGCMVLDGSYGSFFTYPFNCVTNSKTFVCELFLGGVYENDLSDEGGMLKFFGITLKKGK